MNFDKNKRIPANKSINQKQDEIDETDFLEYDAPYKDDPFKEKEVIISQYLCEFASVIKK